MPSFAEQLLDILKANGWVKLRNGKGDHVIWQNPKTRQTLSIDMGTKSRHSVNEHLKKAGLPKAF